MYFTRLQHLGSGAKQKGSESEGTRAGRLHCRAANPPVPPKPKPVIWWDCSRRSRSTEAGGKESSWYLQGLSRRRKLWLLVEGKEVTWARSHRLAGGVRVTEESPLTSRCSEAGGCWNWEWREITYSKVLYCPLQGVWLMVLSPPDTLILYPWLFNSYMAPL